MSLFLQIGTATLPVNTVRATSRNIKAVEVNRFIIAYDVEQTFEGYLYANGPGGLSASMASLEDAISVTNQPVYFISTETGVTQHALNPSGSIGGVVVTGLQYPDTPLSMATQVKFTMTVSARYGNTALKRDVISLVETVRIQGDGGPDDVLAEQAGLPAIYQRLAEYTKVFVTQSGKLISKKSTTEVPGPIITTAGAKISANTSLQKQIKQVGTDILLYEQDYSYTFQLPQMPVTPIIPTILV